MKHHLRHDKTCLNCGATVVERYCSRCGQENLEPKESFGHLISHFFEDVTHYDSKFLVSMRDLLFKPGFLTKEYLLGKRASYLHPIRMYVFISFLYFLSVLLIIKPEHGVEAAITHQAILDAKVEMADSLHHMLSGGKSATGKDSVIRDLIAKLRLDSVQRRLSLNFQIMAGIDYRSLLAYDSTQKALPGDKRDVGLKPWLYGRWLKTLNEYGEATVNIVAEKTLHLIPKLMFFLLPLFAGLLKLFYSRKKYYYADHAIFALHFHSAVLILFLVFDMTALLFPAAANFLSIAELLLALVYLVAALKNAYGQSLGRSLLKGLGLGVLYIICIVAGFIAIGVGSLL